MLRGVAATTAILVALVAAPTVAAKTYKVTTRSDHAPGACTAGDCTLREAVIAANGTLTTPDTIVLPSTKPYKLTIPGTDEGGAMTGDLDITNSRLRIVHPGKGKATIGGNALDRVFEVFAPATFEKLVIRNGRSGGLSGHGGGIAAYVKVTLLGSSVTGNVAGICGGGIHLSAPAARLVMRSSSVTKNRSDADGGGISASCHGGIGSVSIRNSTISGNRADANGDGTGRGGGIYLQTSSGIQSEIRWSTFANNRSGSEGGGAYIDLGRVRIEASTFNGNISRLGGGGLSVDGTEPLIVLNTTVAGNKSASNGGGIYADGSSVVRLNSVTVVRNRGNTDGMFSEAGGGLFSDVLAGDFIVRNSIVSSNAVTDLVPGNPPVKSDCANVDGRPFLSLGHNLLTTRFACDGFTKTGDRVKANPKIGNLGKHGGPTATIPLLKGSPALNRADGSAPKRDQRGVRRSNPDIGAYERRT